MDLCDLDTLRIPVGSGRELEETICVDNPEESMGSCPSEHLKGQVVVITLLAEMEEFMDVTTDKCGCERATNDCTVSARRGLSSSSRERQGVDVVERNGVEIVISPNGLDVNIGALSSSPASLSMIVEGISPKGYVWRRGRHGCK